MFVFMNNRLSSLFNFFKYKFQKYSFVFKHFFFACLVLIILFIGWYKSLDFYVEKGEYIKVPLFVNKHISTIDVLAKKNNLKFRIIDSVYDKSKRKGIVISQYPKKNTNVKRGKSIDLIITAISSRLVNFPNIIDQPMSIASNLLESSGLLVGELNYVKDYRHHQVLGFSVNGEKIEVGNELFYGTKIDLTIGEKSSDSDPVPDLTGLSRDEAHKVLKSYFFNVGSEIFDNVSDSSKAIVIKQSPSTGSIRRLGSQVNLHYYQVNQDTLQ